MTLRGADVARPALVALALACSGVAAGPGCRADNPAAADAMAVANSAEPDDYSFDAAAATVIALDTGSITASGAGVSVEGTRARITEAGTYIVRGALADGQIEVDAGAEARVKLILDGVRIATSDDAPILVRSAAKAILYLPPDTVSTLSDGTASTRDGAIHCKTRLSIFGPGRLNVVGHVDDGINAEGGIVIEDGVYDVRASQAGIKSDVGVTINGGTFTIDAGTDGIHGEETLTINGGDITIARSLEGIEAATIMLGGGRIHIASSDDGVNASSGGGGEMGGGFPGPGEAGSNPLFVRGGYLYVNAEGDGLDINGPIEMTGGTVIIDGPTRNDNGAIDYTGSFQVAGGFFLGVGSAGMAQAPSTSSTQSSVGIVFSSAQAAGTFVHIRDSEGDDIATFRPAKRYQVVVLSSPRLERASGYSVYTGGYSTGVEADGLFTGGSYVGGTLKATFDVSGALTVVRVY